MAFDETIICNLSLTAGHRIRWSAQVPEFEIIVGVNPIEKIREIRAQADVLGERGQYGLNFYVARIDNGRTHIVADELVRYAYERFKDGKWEVVGDMAVWDSFEPAYADDDRFTITDRD